MPRAKLVDTKPRGRMSAYAFFVQSCREEHRKKHPDENVVFSEFSRKCAERWKIMTEKEKQRFHDMADRDKVRYDTEMQGYKRPRNARVSRKKRVKDPNAPKRALSAFFWFCKDERPKVREDNPDMGVGEVAKMLGARWNSIAPETKAKYESIAEDDRARFLQENEAYKAGKFGAKRQKGDSEKTKTEDGNDDDEEESESEEEEEEEED